MVFTIRIGYFMSRLSRIWSLRRQSQLTWSTSETLKTLIVFIWNLHYKSASEHRNEGYREKIHTSKEAKKQTFVTRRCCQEPAFEFAFLLVLFFFVRPLFSIITILHQFCFCGRHIWRVYFLRTIDDRKWRIFARSRSTTRTKCP